MPDFDPAKFGLRRATSETELIDAPPEPVRPDKAELAGLRPVPMERLSDEEIYNSAVESRGKFSPIQYFYANKDRLSSNPEYVAKFASVHDRLRQRGFEVEDLPVVSQAFKASDALAKGDIGEVANQGVEAVKEVAVPVGHFAKGVVKQAWNYADVLGPGMLWRLYSGRNPFDSTQQRKVAENFSGTELAVTGLGQQAGRALNKVAAPFRGERSQKDKENALWAKVGEIETNEQIAKGHGGFLGSEAIGKYVIEDLEKEGKGVRPEEAHTLAAGDPFSLWAFGKIFQGAHKLTPAPVGRAIARVEGAASRVAPKVLGGLVQATGKTGARAAKVAGKSAALVPIASIGAGLVKAGPVGGLAGATVGSTAKRVLQRYSTRAAEFGSKLAEFGKNLRTDQPLGSYGQLVRDLAQSAPKVATEVAKGTAVDLPLAVATSELPEETAAAVTLGTVFGLGKGVYRGGRHVVSGQIVAPRPWHNTAVERSSGDHPVAEQVHKQAYDAAPPGIQTRIDGIRQVLRSVGASPDFFYTPTVEGMTRALAELGHTPEQAAQIAQSQGVFIAQGRNGRPVTLVREIDAAPHESFHPIQDVLGERGNRPVDEAIQKSYNPAEWEAIGVDYAARLLGISAEEAVRANLNWREVILDRSGWGEQAAGEKILRDTSEMMREPIDTPAVTEAAGDVFAQMIQNQGWRQVVNSKSRREIADRYIARELAAEQWDGVLGNLGPTLTGSNTLPGFMSRVAAGLMKTVGAEPLAERFSTEGTPLRYEATQAVTRAARGLKPEDAAPPAAAPEVAPRNAPRTPRGEQPTTPEAREQVAQESREVAQAAPDITLPGANRSQREILGTVADAIASDQGVRYNYRSAPEAPGARIEATRTARRAEIEAARNMPEDVRRMVETTGLPFRIARTSGGVLQIFDWAPDMFAANAFRWARSLSELAGRDPNNAALKKVPYELDVAKGEWTEQGWRDLFADSERFSKNQLGGSTGSGLPLVIPESVRASGRYAPPRTSPPVALEQGRADFINLLYNLQVPKTPRIAGERLPLNVVGQRVSEATLPGRVVEPSLVERRGGRGERAPFTGERAQSLGIEGERIRETNPLRAALETSMQRENVALPEGIEVVRRLNVEHLADAVVEPNLPRSVGGNVLTLTAGFQPARRGTEGSGDTVMLYRGQDSSGAAAGVWWTRNPAKAASYAPDGKVHAIEIPVDAAAAAKRAAEQQGQGGDTFVVPPELTKNARPVNDIKTPVFQFQAERLKAVEEAKTPEQWSELTSAFEGRYGGGLTGMAFEIGALATPEILSTLRSSYDAVQTAAKEAMAARDMTNAMFLVTKKQFYLEAIEAATGEGSSAEFIRKNYDPAFEPPLAGDKAGPTQFQPAPRVRELAEEYAKGKGLSINSERPAATPDPEFLKTVADFYRTAEDAPNDPAVRRSYDALIDETVDQYRQIIDDGYTIEPWKGEGEPYRNSAEAIADIRDNKHLFYFKTEKGFGAEEGSAKENHMLRDSGIIIDGENAPANDIFRAVHDFYGHAKDDFQFGPKGEFNAWAAHSEMYSPEAQGALAAETLAQNAFVNFGPHMRNEQGGIRRRGDEGFLELRDRPFAEQKNLVIPDEIIRQARAKARGEQPDAAELPRTVTRPQPRQVEKGAEDVAKKLEEKATNYSPDNYFEAPPLPSVTSKAQSIGQDTKPYASAWVTRDGKGSYVDSGASKFYHDDAVVGFEEFEGDPTSGAFQYETGAMRVAVHQSRAYLNDNGGGTMGVSVSRKPTDRQIRYITDMLTSRTEDGAGSDLLFGSVGVDVMSPDGLVVAGRLFDIYGKSSVGGVASFLRDPTFTEVPAPRDAPAVPREVKMALSEKVSEEALADLPMIEQAQLLVRQSEMPFEERMKLLGPRGITSEAQAEEIVRTLRGQFQPEKAREQKHSWLDRSGNVYPVKGSTHSNAVGSLPGLEGIASESVGKVISRDPISAAFDKGFLRVTFSGKELIAHNEKSDLTLPQRRKLVEIAEENEMDRVSFDRGEREPLVVWTFDESPAAQFQAAKRKGAKVTVEKKGAKKNFKLKPGGRDGISKAWILPNGDPIQLGPTWHHQWLSENPKMQERFRLKVPKFDGTDTEGVREQALKRGFVRINYSSNSGRLTVEGREKDWRYQKNPVFDFIEKNFSKIDNVEIALLNDNATKVVDAASEKLFIYDKKKDALENIPFITGVEGRKSFQPGDRKKKAFSDSLFFDDEVAQVKSGEQFGQTFTASGDVWSPKDNKVDVVTMASVNIPRKELTPDAVRKAVEPYRDMLDEDSVVAGVFNFEDGKTPMTSIDINAIVPKKYRENTLEFAKDNDQIAIWDSEIGDVVASGGKGDTVLKSPSQIAPAARLLVKGKAVDIPRILSRNPVLAPEDQPVRPFIRDEIVKMNQAQLRERFPEALIPKKKDAKLGSKLQKAPLLKGARSESEKVKRYADKLVAEARLLQGRPEFESGTKWYSEFVPALKAEYGDWAPRMAQLLAASSPKTNPEINFRFAHEALRQWQDGRFNRIISKFREGLGVIADDKWLGWLEAEADKGNITLPAKPSPATFLAEWVNKYDLKPRQLNGKLYGSHGSALLKVFADIWLTENRGPKTLQFVQNLAGENHGATIDVWAQRTMRRLGYEGFQDRWRVMSRNDDAVSDSDFAFSQKAFAEAAAELGMTPDALQGGMWFAEKMRWFREGWADLELGDYKLELGKVKKLDKKYKAGRKAIPAVEPRKR